MTKTDEGTLIRLRHRAVKVAKAAGRTRICAHCSREFPLHRGEPDQTYCSQTCWGRARGGPK